MLKFVFQFSDILMTKILTFCYSLIIINSFCFANDFIYKLNSNDYYFVGAAGLGLLGASQIKIEPQTKLDIDKLDKSTINSLDRPTTDNYDPDIAKVSDYMLAGSFLIPAINFTKVQSIEDISTVSGMYIEAALITNFLTTITKRTVQRERPFNYNPAVPESDKTDTEAKVSFFSGHASNSFMNCVFAAKVFDDLNPNSAYTPYVWGGCLAYATSVSYMRVAAGKHFPTDVIVGALVGSAIGYLVPELHKRNSSQSFNLQPNGQAINLGYKISYTYMF